MTAVRQRALPAQGRPARSLDVGFEIGTVCEVHTRHWLPVVDTLHLAAPPTVTLTVDTAGRECVGGNQVTVGANVAVYSRRPAMVVTQ